MLLKTRLLATAVTVAVLGLPGQAAAATTVGQIATSANAGFCNGGFDVWQGEVANQPSYVIPTGGVVTSWSTYQEAARAARLKVFRGAPTGSSTVVGVASTTPTSAGINVMSARISVQAGDHIGMFVGTFGSHCLVSTTVGDTVRSSTGNAAQGATVQATSTFQALRVNVSAVVEPDADGDGYGDETQDACPDNPNGHDVATCNQAPVASNDSYTHFGSDTALNVSAPGVLGNDTDADNDALTVALVTGPSNGTLTLSANGSFSYRPRENFVGTDSFTYKANDGEADSTTATVTITVGAGCNGKKATHVGTAGPDNIVGTNGNDVIVGGAGDDRLFGKAGDDTMCGGSGHDRLRGDGGTDSLNGGSEGNDWLDGGTGNDRLEGDGGNDTLFGGVGADELDGGDGVDGCERGAGDVKRDKCENTNAPPVPN